MLNGTVPLLQNNAIKFIFDCKKEKNSLLDIDGLLLKVFMNNFSSFS